MEFVSWFFTCMVSGTFLNSNTSDGWDIYNGWMMQEAPSKYSKPTYSKINLFLYGRRVHVLILAVVTTGSVNLQACSSVYCCLLYCSGQSVADCGTCRPS